MESNWDGNLPENWAEATIGDLIGTHGVFKDGDWVESKDQDQNGQVRLIQLADIGDGEFRDKSSRFLTPEKAIELNCTFLKVGDILVARMPDPLGRACIFPLQGSKGFVTVVDVCVIRFGNECINAKYFMYALNSPTSRKSISGHQTGSTRKRISRGNLSTVQFPIAPLNEQHRIVAKIEELFSELDKGIENLKTAQAQLKVYRQALLKHAFEGKLTTQWRTENQDKLETAEALLKRIQQERAQRYQQQLADWEKSPSVPLLQRGKTTSSATTSSHPPLKKGGRGDLKPKAPKPLPPLTAEELAELPELPEGWGWEKLGNIADLIGGVTKGKDLKGKEKISLPYLRVANVQDGYLDLTEIKNIEVETQDKDKYRLEFGDVLYTEGGDKDKLGRGAVWRSQIESCIHQNHIFRARVFDGLISPEILSLYSQTKSAKKYFFRHAKQTTNLASINLTVLGNLPVAIVCQSEQKQILQEIEARLSEVDQLDQTITTSLQQAEALRQSILKKAFAGLLVPQDPHDEPASALLARIKAEKMPHTEKSQKSLARGKRNE